MLRVLESAATFLDSEASAIFGARQQNLELLRSDWNAVVSENMDFQN